MQNFTAAYMNEWKYVRTEEELRYYPCQSRSQSEKTFRAARKEMSQLLFTVLEDSSMHLCSFSLIFMHRFVVMLLLS